MKQSECLVEVSCFFLKRREFRSSLASAGTASGLFLSLPGSRRTSGEADLPGRDMLQPAAILAQERHAQNFASAALRRRQSGRARRPTSPARRSTSRGVPRPGTASADPRSPGAGSRPGKANSFRHSSSSRVSPGCGRTSPQIFLTCALAKLSSGMMRPSCNTGIRCHADQSRPPECSARSGGANASKPRTATRICRFIGFP